MCYFDKTWSACQRDDGSCHENISEFVMVQFSYNQTKRWHDHQCNVALWSDLTGLLNSHGQTVTSGIYGCNGVILIIHLFPTLHNYITYIVSHICYQSVKHSVTGMYKYFCMTFPERSCLGFRVG